METFLFGDSQNFYYKGSKVFFVFNGIEYMFVPIINIDNATSEYFEGIDTKVQNS